MSLSSKLVILKNEKENSLIISLIENNKLVLGILPDTGENNSLENYGILGELFKSIGTLDKNKKIKIYIHLAKTPLAFLIFFVKINVITGSNIEVFVKDKETIKTINEFLLSDPTDLKNLIPLNSEENIETEADTQCESNLKEKLNKLIQENTNTTPDQFFSSTKNLKESLKDSIDNLTKDSMKENSNQIKNLHQTLEFIERISENDKFQKLLEGNNSNGNSGGSLQKEIQKLSLTLF